MALRANGWSLAKISKHLNIPKTTRFRWEEKNADAIHLLSGGFLYRVDVQTAIAGRARANPNAARD